MKVLHINGNFIWSTLHQLMIKELSNLGVENRVFVPTYEKQNATIEVDNNVIVDECFKKRDRFLFFYKQSKIIQAVESKINLESFDLIHAYTLFTDGNAAMELSKKYGIPYVVAVRNTDINDFFQYRLFLRRKGIEILQNASAVFFLSNSYRDKTINKYVPGKLKDVIKEKSYIIPNGIDNFWLDNIFEERDFDNIKNRISEKEVRLIFAGTIENNKNPELTAAAAEKMINNGWKIHFSIIGRVIDKELAKRLTKKDFITLIDKMPKEALIKKYRESDIFVMPSHYETFGLVYAEAMSQGLPVLYTKGQGFDGQFAEGVVGYSVSDMDPNDIYNGIVKIANNYQGIVDSCIENVNKFDWSAITKEYLNIYKSIIQRS